MANTCLIWESLDLFFNLFEGKRGGLNEKYLGVAWGLKDGMTMAAIRLGYDEYILGHLGLV